MAGPTFIDPNTGKEREVGSENPAPETVDIFNPKTGENNYAFVQNLYF